MGPCPFWVVPTPEKTSAQVYHCVIVTSLVAACVGLTSITLSNGTIADSYDLPFPPNWSPECIPGSTSRCMMPPSNMIEDIDKACSCVLCRMSLWACSLLPNYFGPLNIWTTNHRRQRVNGGVMFFFYRAMHFSAKRGLAIACRLSVCPSVTLVDCDHI